MTKTHKYSIDGLAWCGFLSQIIKRTFNVLQTIGTYAHVNFGGFTTIMPQKILNITQIRSAFQQVSSVAVS